MDRGNPTLMGKQDCRKLEWVKLANKNAGIARLYEWPQNFLHLNVKCGTTAWQQSFGKSSCESPSFLFSFSLFFYLRVGCVVAVCALAASALWHFCVRSFAWWNLPPLKPNLQFVAKRQNISAGHVALHNCASNCDVRREVGGWSSDVVWYHMRTDVWHCLSALVYCSLGFQ